MCILYYPHHHLTFDNLLSHRIVELLLSCIGLEDTVKVVRLTLWWSMWEVSVTWHTPTWIAPNYAATGLYKQVARRETFGVFSQDALMGPPDLQNKSQKNALTLYMCIYTTQALFNSQSYIAYVSCFWEAILFTHSPSLIHNLLSQVWTVVITRTQTK